MHLADLHVVEVARGDLCHVGHEHGAEGKVGRDQRADTLTFATLRQLIDERVRQALRPEEISVGDYVLTGGELAGLVMIDASTRLILGVLGDAASTVEESFSEGFLEYPHYTRPVEVRGMAVPEVLISGHHEAIRLWRRKEALRNTYLKRPDLLRNCLLQPEDRKLLNEVMQESLVHVPVR